MNAFDYAAPQSVDEALSLLKNGNGKVGIFAGGTDILPQIKENRRKIDLLLDIKKLPEANVLTYDAKNGLRIGSAVSCSDIYSHPDVRTHYPALVDCASLIGSVQIQNRSTIGGNMCNASPAGDSPPALIVLEAVCEVIGPKGKRDIAAEKFFVSPGRSALEAGELLLAIRVPAPKAHSGAFSLRFIPRNEMDIAVANAAVSLVLNGNTITSARVAIGAVAPTPLLVAAAGAALAGQKISDEVIEKACVASRAAAKPITDMRGTIEQRVHLAGILTKRAILGAIERAKES